MPNKIKNQQMESLQIYLPAFHLSPHIVGVEKLQTVSVSAEL